MYRGFIRLEEIKTDKNLVDDYKNKEKWICPKGHSYDYSPHLSFRIATSTKKFKIGFYYKCVKCIKAYRLINWKKPEWYCKHRNVMYLENNRFTKNHIITVNLHSCRVERVVRRSF